MNSRYYPAFPIFLISHWLLMVFFKKVNFRT